MKTQVLGALLLLAGPAVPLSAQEAIRSEQASATPLAELQAAAPATGQAASQAETKADEEKNNKKVCKVMAVTGSRFNRKLCHTQQEWDTIDRAHKDKMREIDSQPVNVKSD